MADDRVRLACDAESEAQRNVVKAQEVVDRYEAKIQEIEEKPDFIADNPLYTNFINRLNDAKGSLREREESLRQCREHLKLLNTRSSGGNSGVPHHPGPEFIVSHQYEDAKKYLFDKIDHLTAVIDQAVAMKERLNVMKLDIERFVFVESRNDTTTAARLDPSLNPSPVFQYNGEGAHTPTYAPNGEMIETSLGYRMHIYDGSMHRVPADWRMPRCTVRQLWKQWWIGDRDRQVPPLRLLTVSDVRHLDKIPLTQSELKGRTGKFGKSKTRRKSGKVLSDIRCVMRQITAMIEEAGAMERVITPSSVDHMFAAVSNRLILSANYDHKKWNTFAKEMRVNASSKDLQSSPAPKPAESGHL